MDLSKWLTYPVFDIISKVADTKQQETYVIGGYVRDLFLGRNSKDIDIVTAGNGIALAKDVALELGNEASLSVYQNFGTALIKYKQFEIEFVGARKESYRSHSRNPIVENGTIEDDQKRRDFTINAMAVCLNKAEYGKFTDPFNGVEDIQNKLLRTPLDPFITFSDDPLRMIRAIRFAAQFNFIIYPDTFQGIKQNSERIQIVSQERIIDETNKILLSDTPSKGFLLMLKTNLLQHVFPELYHLQGVEVKNGKGHKDILFHTLKVLDNISQSNADLWLRWAALYHDVGKPATKKFEEGTGWTFHGHDFIGCKMIPEIFRRHKLPLNEKMKYVQKIIKLHLRPISLINEEVSDSAIRRLIYEAGDDIDDLMTLCEADITSQNELKVEQFLQNFKKVREKINFIEEKDAIRNFEPPVKGDEIMKTFGITPCKEVGIIKNTIKDAILDGKIHNNYEEARALMLEKGKELGLKPAGKQ